MIWCNSFCLLTQEVDLVVYTVSPTSAPGTQQTLSSTSRPHYFIFRSVVGRHDRAIMASGRHSGGDAQFAEPANESSQDLHHYPDTLSTSRDVDRSGQAGADTSKHGTQRPRAGSSGFAEPPAGKDLVRVDSHQDTQVDMEEDLQNNCKVCASDGAYVASVWNTSLLQSNVHVFYNARDIFVLRIACVSSPKQSTSYVCMPLRRAWSRQLTRYGTPSTTYSPRGTQCCCPRTTHLCFPNAQRGSAGCPTPCGCSSSLAIWRM